MECSICIRSSVGNQFRGKTSLTKRYFFITNPAEALWTFCSCFFLYFGMLWNSALQKSSLGSKDDLTLLLSHMIWQKLFQPFWSIKCGKTFFYCFIDMTRPVKVFIYQQTKLLKTEDSFYWFFVAVFFNWFVFEIVYSSHFFGSNNHQFSFG